MTRIFISYRRSDSVPTVGRLFDRLIQRYGDASVVWDQDSFLPGQDFRREIARHLENSDVVLATIGPRWMGAASHNGNRLYDDDDFVRAEIEASFGLGIPVIPVLVQGATMPGPEQLPETIRDLSFLSAIELQEGRLFDHGYRTLIDEIDRLGATGTSTMPSPARQHPGRGTDSVDPSLAAITSLLGSARRKRDPLCVRSVATLKDLRAIWEIDSSAYGDANVAFEVYQSWWLAYRLGVYALFHDDRPIGAIGLWPVPEEWIDRFRAGSAGEADLDPELIERAGAAPAMHWYVSGVVLDPAWQHTGAIATLLRETTLCWIVESELGYPLHMSAIAISDPGEQLLNRYGFELTTPASRMKDGYSLYERTLSRRDVKLLMPNL